MLHVKRFLLGLAVMAVLLVVIAGLAFIVQSTTARMVIPIILGAIGVYATGAAIMNDRKGISPN